MNVLYVRVSHFTQNSDRQKINQKDFNLVVEDKCSGSIAFSEREGGKRILKLLKSNELQSLSIISIDRLGRNLNDLLNIIDLFNKKNVPINFINQGLRTLDSDGKENNISKMIISILGVVAEMERNQIRERQAEGIALAKAKGLFNGRKIGSKEDSLKFLSKPKNKKALEYLKKGSYSYSEISKIVGININTVTKIKRIGIAAV